MILKIDLFIADTVLYLIVTIDTVEERTFLYLIVTTNSVIEGTVFLFDSYSRPPHSTVLCLIITADLLIAHTVVARTVLGLIITIDTIVAHSVL